MNIKIVSPKNRISRHYARRVKQILSRFNDIRELIENKGMKGARVEREVRKLLVEFLPEQYNYSSGIVIDNSGSECDRSRQEDILIIDRFFNPKLFLDEEPSIYPVEIVYCGIEVKTSLGAAELKDAVKNIASLKRLRYIKERIAFSQGGALSFAKTSAPIGIIFAFDSPMKGSDTLLKHYSESIKQLDREIWPDLVCILNRGIMGIDKENKPIFQLHGLPAQDAQGHSGTVIVYDPSEAFIHEGQQYPVVLFDNNYCVVDVARVFISFLVNLYEGLLNKVIMANSNLFRHYVPKEWAHFRSIDADGNVKG